MLYSCILKEFFNEDILVFNFFCFYFVINDIYVWVFMVYKFGLYC